MENNPDKNNSAVFSHRTQTLVNNNVTKDARREQLLKEDTRSEITVNKDNASVNFTKSEHEVPKEFNRLPNNKKNTVMLVGVVLLVISIFIAIISYLIR